MKKTIKIIIYSILFLLMFFIGVFFGKFIFIEDNSKKNEITYNRHSNTYNFKYLDIGQSIKTNRICNDYFLEYVKEQNQYHKIIDLNSFLISENDIYCAVHFYDKNLKSKNFLFFNLYESKKLSLREISRKKFKKEFTELK